MEVGWRKELGDREGWELEREGVWVHVRKQDGPAPLLPPPHTHSGCGQAERYSQLVEGLSIPSSAALGKLCPAWAVSSADLMALSWAVSMRGWVWPPIPGPDSDCCMKASLSLVLRFMSSHLCLMSLMERGTWLTEVTFRAMPSQILSLSAWDSRMVSLPKRTAS